VVYPDKPGVYKGDARPFTSGAVRPVYPDKLDAAKVRREVLRVGSGRRRVAGLSG